MYCMLDFKKNMSPLTKDNAKKFDLINEYIKIYKILLLKLISDDSKIKTNNIGNFEICCNKLNNIKIEIDNLYILESFVVILDNKINNTENFFETFLLYLKKINKKTDIIKKSKEKTYLEDFNLYIEDSTDKFIDWLIN